MAVKMFSTKEEVDIALKPCPFCGGTDFEVNNKAMFEELLEEHGAAHFYILCECKAQMSIYDAKSYKQALDMIAEKWNRRANENECEEN